MNVKGDKMNTLDLAQFFIEISIQKSFETKNDEYLVDYEKVCGLIFIANHRMLNMYDIEVTKDSWKIDDDVIRTDSTPAFYIDFLNLQTDCYENNRFKINFINRFVKEILQEVFEEYGKLSGNCIQWNLIKNYSVIEGNIPLAVIKHCSILSCEEMESLWKFHISQNKIYMKVRE